MNADELITLNEEIAAMARAGLPLDQGLAALAREMRRGPMRRVTGEIAADLRAGRTLGEAFQRQAGRLPPYYAGLVTAGVRTGRISEVLITLSQYARLLSDLRATIINAMFYPVIVLLFALVLIGFISFFIIPQFKTIFLDFQMTLPFISEVVLAIGGNPLAYVFLPLAGIVAVFFLGRFFLLRSPWGQLAWTRFMYGIPGVGTLMRSARMAAFTELLAILLDHEAPLPEALQLAGAASSDPILTSMSRQVQQELAEGKPLSEVLRRSGAVPELVAWMTGLGEQRGMVAKSLHQVADVYRRQSEMRALMVQSVLPSFFIIAVGGLLVALFILALMLPLVRLLDDLSK